MPLFLLIALFIAFGFEESTPAPGLAGLDPGAVVAETLGGIALVAAMAFALRRRVLVRMTRLGHGTSALRRRYVWGARGLELLSLVVFAGIVREIGWPRLVRERLDLGGLSIVGDALILLPYLLMQLSVWWVTYPAERALRSNQVARRPAGLGRHLALRARQTLGLVLPVLLVFSIGQDLLRHYWPGWSSNAWAQTIEVAVIGAMVLALSPLFVRTAWPTHPLPPGPLRDRLEHLTRRLGFRCSEILVWDTGQVLVNACVTGALPWFRYVLLSDALIECLDEHEVAAVFGHELGHIAHRHLIDFGFFFVASAGILALFNTPIDAAVTGLTAWLGGREYPALATILEPAAVLAPLALYVLVVFGYISRRFERQADVFGCQAVSCGQDSCPPHRDIDRMAEPGPPVVTICPVGIRIFANALANVALLNGIEPRARSWRHGSIARRIAFLEGLEGNPDAVRRFQRGVSRLRSVIALVLVTSLAIAAATGSIALWR